MITAGLRYYVDWNGDGDFSDSYEEITSFVRKADWRLGRDSVSELSFASAGVANLTLDNSDGRFSSLNSTSPIYGSILPYRKVKITSTVGGTTTTQWQGYLDSINPSPKNNKDHTAALRALGPISILAAAEVSIAMHANITTGAAIIEILDAVGWPSGDRTIDNGQTTMSRWWTEDTVNALNAIRDIEATEGGFLRETKDGKLVFEDRANRLSHTSQANYTSTIGTSNINYAEISQDSPLRDVFSVVKANARVFDETANKALWSYSGNAIAVPAGGSVEIWSNFPSAMSEAGEIAVYPWGTITKTANAAANGSGANMTSSISIVATQFAFAQKMIISNSAGVTAYITGLSCNGIAVIERDPVGVRASDPSTVLPYPRTYIFPGKFLSDVAEAQSFCDHFLALHKDPRAALEIVLFPSASDAIMAESLARDISDKITVVASSGATTLGVNGDFFVEQIQHDVDYRAGEHWLTVGANSALTHTWDATSASYTPLTYAPPTIEVGNKTYHQTTAPSSGLSTGDLWFDTDASNKLYRWSGSEWVAVPDSAKISTFVQSSIPTSTTSGDLWVDTTDGLNEMYRADVPLATTKGDGAWRNVRDIGAAKGHAGLAANGDVGRVVPDNMHSAYLSDYLSDNAPNGSFSNFSISHVNLADGSADVTFQFDYTQSTKIAAGFVFYFKSGNSAPGAAAISDPSRYVDAIRAGGTHTVKILGVNPSTYYSAGISAFLATRSGRACASLQTPAAWLNQQLETTPNYTGNVNGVAASTVQAGAGRANSGLNADGTVQAGMVTPRSLTGAAGATNGIFSEYWEDQGAGWNASSLGATFPSNGRAGGKVFSLTGAAYATLSSLIRIPYDSSKLHRYRIRLRRTSADGVTEHARTHVGWALFNAAGIFLEYDWHVANYIWADECVKDQWYEFTGWFKGTTATPDNDLTSYNNPLSPCSLNSAGVYIAPCVACNHAGVNNTSVLEIDYITIDTVEESLATSVFTGLNSSGVIQTEVPDLKLTTNARTGITSAVAGLAVTTGEVRPSKVVAGSIAPLAVAPSDLAPCTAPYVETFEEASERAYSVAQRDHAPTYPSNGVNGGKVLHATGPYYVYTNGYYPVDKNRMYRVSGRVRKTMIGTDSHTYLIGFYIYDKTFTSISTGWIYWGAGSNLKDAGLNEWVEFAFYLKGEHATSFGAGTLDNPWKWMTNTAYCRPAFVLNWPGGEDHNDNETEIDSFSMLPMDEALALRLSTGLGSDGTVNPSMVDGDAIQSRAITAAKIAAGTITAYEIAANTITASQIYAGTITAVELSASYAVVGSVQANTVVANLSITTPTITGGTIQTAASGERLVITDHYIKQYNSSDIVQFAVYNMAGSQYTYAIKLHSPTIEGVESLKVASGQNGFIVISKAAGPSGAVTVTSDNVVANTSMKVGSTEVSLSNHNHSGVYSAVGHAHAYSDITSGAPTLGNSAAKDVGTGSTNVAAGDHNHSGVYATSGHNHDSDYAPLSIYSGGNIVAPIAVASGSSISTVSGCVNIGGNDTTSYLALGGNYAIRYPGAPKFVGSGGVDTSGTIKGASLTLGAVTLSEAQLTTIKSHCGA